MRWHAHKDAPTERLFDDYSMMFDVTAITVMGMNCLNDLVIDQRLKEYLKEKLFCFLPSRGIQA